jgi:RND family efflux transporter MFP subunit
MTDKWMKWAAAAAVVLLLAGGAAKAFKARQAKLAQAADAAAAQRLPTVFELSAQDVVQVRTRTLVQGVTVSGALRATQTATLKAKVAGELQGLQVREGDAVQAGQTLARIDTTEYQARVQQADQQARAADAQVAIAQRQLGNNQALVNQGFISKTALDTSLANLDAAQASHRAALAALDIARKSLADTVVRSPIAGQVASRLVQNGERVGVDARLLEIVNLDTLELEAAVPPAAAAQLRVGQSAQLTVEGLPQTLSARVARISPSAQAASRSVLVYLTLPASPGLRQGLFAQGDVWVGEQTGLALPASSVRNDKPVPYVQRLTPGEPGAPARITHVPVKVLAQGVDKAALNGPEATVAPEPMVITESVAENSMITSVRAGFIQENTLIQPPTAPSATRP